MALLLYSLLERLRHIIGNGAIDAYLKITTQGCEFIPSEEAFEERSLSLLLFTVESPTPIPRCSDASSAADRSSVCRTGTDWRW